MKVHELKCWPEFFEPIVRGKKTFEYRVNDRNYQVGDILEILEWDKETGDYTGRVITAFVPYLLSLHDGDRVVMSIEIQEMHL